MDRIAPPLFHFSIFQCSKAQSALQPDVRFALLFFAVKAKGVENSWSITLLIFAEHVVGSWREAHLGLTPRRSLNNLGNQTALRLAVPRPLKLPLQCVLWIMGLEISEEV